MRRLPLLLAALALAGCVDRLVEIRTEPPGASVLLDGEPAGTTPCEVRYEWYGTRDLVLEKKGYRSVRRELKLAPPWWQIPPFDAITDVVIPFTITDRLVVEETLEPAPVSLEEVDEVLRRADELRTKAAAPE